MEIQNIVEKDFKKWILFNNQLRDFKKLYELYTSIESKSGKSGVEIAAEGDCYIIEQQGYQPKLEIPGEEGRVSFLDYLAKLYLPNQTIEEWYLQRIEAEEKALNHKIHKKDNQHLYKNTTFNFKVHPKELQYLRIRVFFSVVVYLILIGTIIGFSLTSIYSAIMLIGFCLIILGFVALVKRILQGYFIGIIKGNAVKINEHQYPDIFKVINDQAQEVGLSDVPEVYVSNGTFNAFVTRFGRKKYLMLYSEVIETANKGDYEVLKFVVGHELGHIRRRHLSSEAWLFPSSFIPFLKLAHRRAKEYTCDRIGSCFSSQGAIEGILILATGKHIHSKIDVSRFVKDATEDPGFWFRFSEKFQSHPHLSKRLAAIKKYVEEGK